LQAGLQQHQIALLTFVLIQNLFCKSLFCMLTLCRLVLKTGMPVMLLRNLHSDLGMMNGTRLRLDHIGQHGLQVRQRHEQPRRHPLRDPPPLTGAAGHHFDGPGPPQGAATLHPSHLLDLQQR
jgi:hypothetical protein